MDKKKRFSQILAITGAVLLLLPIVAMIFFSIRHGAGSGEFMMDYLIPGELFPVVLLGAALVLWAALREKLLLKPVIWGCSLALFGLVVGQVAAILTGVASGAHEFEGWRMILTAGLLILYDLAALFLGITGIRLACAIKQEPKPQD